MMITVEIMIPNTYDHVGISNDAALFNLTMWSRMSENRVTKMLSYLPPDLIGIHTLNLRKFSKILMKYYTCRYII